MLPPKSGAVMRTEDFLRVQAAQCFELADRVTEPELAQKLRAIGQAFLEKAAELTTTQGPRSNDHNGEEATN
jgi:hypothetical protein